MERKSMLREAYRRPADIVQIKSVLSSFLQVIMHILLHPAMTLLSKDFVLLWGRNIVEESVAIG